MRIKITPHTIHNKEVYKIKIKSNSFFRKDKNRNININIFEGKVEFKEDDIYEEVKNESKEIELK